MHGTLQLVLVLLAFAVLVIWLFRALRLPPLLGYLSVGVLVGPHGLALVPETESASYLAEFGIVFLMFSVGLEFSLPQLKAMRGIVFGLGSAQVAVTLLAVAGASVALGLSWREGMALGGVLAMSSTAIVGKMLAERVELQTHHGRLTIGVLLFQDLAVVPLLLLIPALAQPSGQLAATLGFALAKAALVLGVILFFGQKLMRPLFLAVAHRKSSELFMLTVLLVTLGLAWLTAINGLSMALGAFLAGMLISETEYRYQVEADIKPFRDVLLGLFFVTVGMQLDFHVLLANLPWVLLVFVALLAGKALLVAGLAMLRGAERHVAVRAALALGQAGEFGFVLLALAADVHLVGPQSLQVVLAAMVLSMLAAPFIIHYNEFLARRLAGGEWADRAVQLHEVAIRSVMANQHVILCGYGRSGQYLARFLEQEGFSFIALDVDPQRVKAAAAAGESVVYGDAARREVLMAAGLNRARAVVVSFADTRAARNILSEVLSMRPGLPVVVRTLDDSDLDSLKEAGAAEVVPEILEGSLMLAFHTLMLLGVPLARVVRRARQVREARYDLLRGFFHGATDADFELNEKVQPRLQSLVLAEGMYAVGKTLAELDLESLLVEVTAVRRRGIRALAPQPEARLEAGDVLILKGTASDLAAAEARLTRG